MQNASDVTSMQLPVLTTTSLFRHWLIFELPQLLMDKLFISHGCHHSSVELWCKASSARAFALLKLGHAERWMGNQSATCVVSVHPPHPALGASKHMHTPHKQNPGFSNPSFCLSGFQGGNGAYLLCMGRHNWDAQIVALTALSPEWDSTLQIPPKGTSPDTMPCFSIHLVM